MILQKAVLVGFCLLPMALGVAACVTRHLVLFGSRGGGQMELWGKEAVRGGWFFIGFSLFSMASVLGPPWAQSRRVFAVAMIFAVLAFFFFRARSP